MPKTSGYSDVVFVKRSIKIQPNSVGKWDYYGPRDKTTVFGQVLFSAVAEGKFYILFFFFFQTEFYVCFRCEKILINCTVFQMNKYLRKVKTKDMRYRYYGFL